MVGPAAAGGKPAEVRLPPGPEPAGDIALPQGTAQCAQNEGWGSVVGQWGPLGVIAGQQEQGDTWLGSSLQPTRAWAAPTSVGTCILWTGMWVSRRKPETCALGTF